MGTAFRVLAALLVVGVLAGLGFTVYNAGVSQGVAQGAGLATASGTPAVVYGGYWGVGPHWGWGFGVFGIFFWILGIFLVFALIRAAFGWGRWGGRGHWTDHGPTGFDGPRGFGGRREMLEAWHREAHERGGTATGPSAGAG